jgi:hypothetical protein
MAIWVHFILILLSVVFRELKRLERDGAFHRRMFYYDAGVSRKLPILWPMRLMQSPTAFDHPDPIFEICSGLMGKTCAIYLYFSVSRSGF